MTANVNYTFISNGIFYTYKYDNTGSYSEAQSVSVSNSVNDTNVTVNTSSISIQNSTVTFTLRLPNSFQIASGSYFLNANGSWTAGGGGGSGNGSLTQVNTGIGLTGGPIDTTGTVSVLANSGIIANSTGLFVNSAYIATLAANSASYLGGNSASDLIGKSNDAYSNAVAIAASDATNKAANAYSNAVATAASDATSKAATAYTNATSYADTKAATAYTNATSYADTKAATAYTNATSYADTKAATAYTNAITIAASDATSKAATAYTNAVSYVDSKSYVNTSQLSANLSNYQTIAGLSANVAGLSANYATYILANNGIVSNSTGVFVNSGTGVVVNTSGVHVNSSYINTISSNSATYLGSVSTFGNSSGVYTTLNINALSYTIGISFTVNATTLFFGNSTVNATINSSTLSIKSIMANGSIGSNGQTLLSNGTGIYWSSSGAGILPIRQQFTANGTQTSYTVTGGYTANQISVFLNGVLLRNGDEVDVSSGSTFTISPAVANGSLIDVVGTSALFTNNVSTIVSQQFTANGTANSFVITNGYLPNNVIVFLNGVKQIPGTDVIITSGNTVNFVVTPANNYVVDVFGYQTSVSYYSNTLVVANTISVNGEYLSPYMYRNKIINGNMFFDQRNASANVSLSTNTAVYTLDRWWGRVAANTTGSIICRDTDVPTGFLNSLKVQRTSGNTGTSVITVGQVIESNNCYDLQGKYITLSFWAKAGANLSNSSISVTVKSGTTANEGSAKYANNTWAGTSNVISTTQAITTTWTRYSVTTAATLGTSIAELGVSFDYTPTGTAGANDWYKITGIQLESGTVATPIEIRPYEQEFILCQQYYQRITTAVNSLLGIYASGTNAFYSQWSAFSTIMRVVPTCTYATAGGGSWYWVVPGTLAYSADSSTGTIITATVNGWFLTQTRQAGGSAPTSGNPYTLETSIYVYASAEL